MELTKSVLAFVAGATIGLGFGLIQQAALRRHERRQQSGNVATGWAIMSGSLGRVAYLLVALALVQVTCPMLFVDSTQWWVSGGVVTGYGAVLVRELYRRRWNLD